MSGEVVVLHYGFSSAPSSELRERLDGVELVAAGDSWAEWGETLVGGPQHVTVRCELERVGEVMRHVAVAGGESLVAGPVITDGSDWSLPALRPEGRGGARWLAGPVNEDLSAWCRHLEEVVRSCWFAGLDGELEVGDLGWSTAADGLFDLAKAFGDVDRPGPRHGGVELAPLAWVALTEGQEAALVSCLEVVADRTNPALEEISQDLVPESRPGGRADVIDATRSAAERLVAVLTDDGESRRLRASLARLRAPEAGERLVLSHSERQAYGDLAGWFLGRWAPGDRLARFEVQGFRDSRLRSAGSEAASMGDVRSAFR